MRTPHLMSVSTALAIVAAPHAANAEEPDGKGFYIALEAGLTSLSDVDITYYDVGGTFGGEGTRDTASGRINTDNAVSFGGALGYDFGTVRTDVEVDYARNKISSLTFDSANGSPVTLGAEQRADVCAYLEVTSCGGSGNTFVFDGSRVRQLSALANLWLDLPIGAHVTPYAGGGVGFAGFEVDGEGKGKFAWQLGAGVAVNLSNSAALSLDFRRRQVGRATIEYDANSGFELGRLKANTFSAGLRFTF